MEGRLTCLRLHSKEKAELKLEPVVYPWGYAFQTLPYGPHAKSEMGNQARQPCHSPVLSPSSTHCLPNDLLWLLNMSPDLLFSKNPSKSGKESFPDPA